MHESPCFIAWSPWMINHDIIHDSSMKIHLSQRTETEKIMITKSDIFHKTEISDQCQNKDSFLLNETYAISATSSKLETKGRKKHRPFLGENNTKKFGK